MSFRSTSESRIFAFKPPVSLGNKRPPRTRARSVRRVARWRRRLRLCRRSAARSSPRSMSRPPVPWTRRERSLPRRVRPSRPRTSRRLESASGRLARARGPAPREMRRSAPSRRPRRPPRARRRPREAPVCSPGASRTTARRLASRASSPIGNRSLRAARGDHRRLRRRRRGALGDAAEEDARPRTRAARAQLCTPPRARWISSPARATRRRSSPKESGASARRRGALLAFLARSRDAAFAARGAARSRRGEAARAEPTDTITETRTARLALRAWRLVARVGRARAEADALRSCLAEALAARAAADAGSWRARRREVGAIFLFPGRATRVTRVTRVKRPPRPRRRRSVRRTACWTRSSRGGSAWTP